MKQSIQEIKEKILSILKEAGATRSEIFGSYVRGEQTEKSDVDILVELPEGKTLFDLGGLQFKLQACLKKKVDLVQEKTIKTQLKPYILSEQIQIL